MWWFVALLGTVAGFCIIAGAVYLLGGIGWRRRTFFILAALTSVSGLILGFTAAEIMRATWDEPDWKADLNISMFLLASTFVLPATLASLILGARGSIGPRGPYQDHYGRKSVLAAVCVVTLLPVIAVGIITGVLFAVGLIAGVLMLLRRWYRRGHRNSIDSDSPKSDN